MTAHNDDAAQALTAHVRSTTVTVHLDLHGAPPLRPPDSDRPMRATRATLTYRRSPDSVAWRETANLEGFWLRKDGSDSAMPANRSIPAGLRPPWLLALLDEHRPAGEL